MTKRKSKSPKPQVNLVGLTFGFAEQQSLGVIYYQSRKKYHNAQAAIRSLARALWSYFQQTNGPEEMECCREFREGPDRIDKDWRHCPKCGRLLDADWDMESFEDWLTQGHLGTLNDWPGDPDVGWTLATARTITNAVKGQVAWLYEAAEVGLIAALDETDLPNVEGLKSALSNYKDRAAYYR
jgi:hypothetical protein